MNELHLSLSDFAAQLNKISARSVSIQQTAPNQITAHYWFDIKLNLLRFSDSSLLFGYELPWGANMLVKLFSGINSKKFTLNTSDKTVLLHLDAFGVYRKQLAGRTIAGVELRNNTLIFQLNEVQAA
ncbi:hypothetical protein QG077_00195 [Kingella kingae]|uniref:hypothetical protein n=1 Tax=Kingella kingae TaxID=504 RepID=UPI00254B6E8B|nr:hypothetical protein [Kingella kingae]MDK4595805.1 hypothetical protein [Kingella kingae]MDK4599680.1 hypothetical protein [Kingella kingae]MDK4653453.1 hypothetical protein [Kingella kingae]